MEQNKTTSSSQEVERGERGGGEEREGGVRREREREKEREREREPKIDLL